MQEVKENQFTFLKFCPAMNIPIYLKVNVSDFDQQLMGFLLRNNFTQMGKGQISEIQENLQKDSHAKILSISLAPPVVIEQIFNLAESDQYGDESIVPNKNYKIYRYRKLALMLYANNSREMALRRIFPFWLIGK